MQITFRPNFGLARAVGAVALCALMAAGAVHAAERADTVIVSGAGSVNTLDPIASNYFQTNDLTSRMYSPLITYDLDLNVVGDLASDYTVADDAQSITFTLREGATFHDGTPVTSKDVAYTLDRIKRLATGVASYIGIYDSTEITDDSTFTIKLSQPSSLFLTSLSRIYIINSALAEANAGTDDSQAWLAANDAGSGPYKLTGVSGNDITIDWAEGYWGERGDLPLSFVFRRVDESAPKRDELRIGNIDVAKNVQQRDLDMIENEPGVSVVYGTAPTVHGVYFNTQVGPTSDPRVRNAIRLAYDYEGAFAGIHRNKGALPAGQIPDALSCKPDLPVVHRDVEGAKALLAEAGQPNLTLTLRFQPAFEEQVQQATLMQSNLAEVGITLNLEPIAFPNYLQMLQDPDQIPQMMLLGENSLFPDPGVFLSTTFMTGKVGTNRSGYSNAEFDELMNTAIVTADADARCDLYKDAQVILEQDSPFMPIWYAGAYAAFRSDRLANPIEGHVSGNFKPLDYAMLPKE